MKPKGMCSVINDVQNWCELWKNASNFDGFEFCSVLPIYNCRVSATGRMMIGCEVVVVANVHKCLRCQNKHEVSNQMPDACEHNCGIALRATESIRNASVR